MTRVLFHQLPGEKRAPSVLREAIRLYEEGRPCLIWVEDSGHRAAFDEYLWNYEKLAFVPHLNWNSGMGEVVDPIVLLGEAGAPNGAEILLVGEGMPPEDWTGRFSEIHEFLPPGDKGESRRHFWEEWQKKQGETA